MAQFKNQFDAVYEGFYDKLLILGSNLSETELTHCIFIKLHSQTKKMLEFHWLIQDLLKPKDKDLK